MTTPEIIRLVIQGTVFLIWAAVLLRELFKLRRRVVAQSGQMLPGPITSLRAVGHWLRAPGDKPARSTLALLTCVLLAMTLSHALLSGL